MRQNCIDWRSGCVTYWALEDLDSDRPPLLQLDVLKEDLAQIQFSPAVLIDVGWYPEFSAYGRFKIKVVLSQNWSGPVFEQEAKDFPQLLTGLRLAVSVAQGTLATHLVWESV